MQRISTKPVKILLCFLILFFIAWWTGIGFAATEIAKVRSWAAPDHTRVVFDVSGEPSYQYQIRENVLILEFTGATLHPSLCDEKKIGKPGVQKIVFTSSGENKSKIEIVLDQYIRVDVFKLRKFMDKPDRVVVDVIVVQEEKKDDAVKEPVSASSGQKKVIVIDPGHGGDDPGAIGKNGTYEKHIVLAIGREIKKAIDKMPGFRAILTRDGDYYVAFSKRLQTARDSNAGLFISVHADAAKNRLARGGSVYCLSTGGASNEAARLLANNENLSDIIGGAPGSEGNNQSDEIILNMLQTNTMNLSKTFATDLLAQVGRVHTLKYPVFHEAPFRVLKLLDTPAVLLETAFLSNVQEEKMLKKSSFQKTIAQAVAASVANYFTGSTAAAAVAEPGISSRTVEPETKKSGDKIQLTKTSVYRVKKGDTLQAIAVRNETTLAMLLKLNRIKMNDPLFVGKKLIVPAPAEAASAKSLKSYVVKKGDTLFSLAKSSSITVEELRRLNNMTVDEALRLGQKIKLPQ